MIISSADTLTRRVHDSSVALAFHAPVATIHSKDYSHGRSSQFHTCPPPSPPYKFIFHYSDLEYKTNRRGMKMTLNLRQRLA